MAGELEVVAQGDALTVYAVIRRLSDATVWQTTTTTFVTWVNANIANYDVALTSKSGDLYQGDFPTDIATGTKVRVNYYSQAGGSPAITDLLLKSIDHIWTGVLSDGGGSVGAAACALVTLSVAKRHLEITDTSKDDLVQQIINQASAMFETAVDRLICDADYVEFFHANNLGCVVLKQYPLNHVTRVATGKSYPLTIEYEGSDIRAIVSVTDTGVRLSSTSAAGTTTLTTSTTFATYPTLSTLRTAIDAVSGWTATASEDGLSQNLYRVGGQNAKDRTVQLAWPDHDLDFYEVNDSAGTVRIGHRMDGFDRWPSPGYGGTVMVEYNAGYTTIPEDIQGVVLEMVSSAMSRTGDTSTTGDAASIVTSEDLGDYSFSASSSTSTNTASAVVDMVRILGENAALIDKYRNHAVAGVC